jgi:hypothetical protein
MKFLAVVNGKSVHKNLGAHKNRNTQVVIQRSACFQMSVRPLPKPPPPFHHRSSHTGGCHFMVTSFAPLGSCSLITHKIPQECAPPCSPFILGSSHLPGCEASTLFPKRGTSELSGCRSGVFVSVILETEAASLAFIDFSTIKYEKNKLSGTNRPVWAGVIRQKTGDLKRTSLQWQKMQTLTINFPGKTGDYISNNF